MKSPLISSLIPVTLLLACCDPAGEETLFADLPPTGWPYTAPVTFHPGPASGQLSVAVCHDASFPYSNLWLEVATATPGHATVTDTVNLTLCDTYGRWLGKGFGGNYQIELPVNPSITVDTATVMTVRHIMRVDTIHGITRLGIHLKP